MYKLYIFLTLIFFFFQAEDGIRDWSVTGVQTCALPISAAFQRGMCFVRKMEGGRMVLTTYGRSSGFCIDPVEKKPLSHFYPGTSILSFGTAGCNLACKFCQNWDISKSREMDRLQDQASPERIADAALELGCKSVAFTYNDPVIFAEYAMDIADACHAKGVKRSEERRGGK